MENFACIMTALRLLVNKGRLIRVHYIHGHLDVHVLSWLDVSLFNSPFTCSLHFYLQRNSLNRRTQKISFY